MIPQVITAVVSVPSGRLFRDLDSVIQTVHNYKENKITLNTADMCVELQLGEDHFFYPYTPIRSNMGDFDRITVELSRADVREIMSVAERQPRVSLSFSEVPHVDSSFSPQ